MTVKKQIRESMLEDIFVQGELVLSHFDSIEKQAKESVDAMDLEKIQNVYMTGCGDSFYAADVARIAFMEYAGMPARAIEAFEFNKYESRYISVNALNIAISISGQVGTTLETIEISKAKGLATLGINATPGSKIYSIADSVVDIGIRVKDFGPVPQTYHFLANMSALFFIALNIGLRKGLIDSNKYSDVRDDMVYNLNTMRENAENLKDKIYDYANSVKDLDPFVFLGAGSNLPTATFAVAKLHEAACMLGIAQEIEEWAHEQYFATNDDTITFVIAPSGYGLERAQAILKSTAKMGYRSVAVADEKSSASVNATDVWIVKAADNEVLSPMTMKLPFELFAYAIADHLDIHPFNYDNKTRQQTCEETIYDGSVSAEEVARRQKK